MTTDANGARHDRKGRYAAKTGSKPAGGLVPLWDDDEAFIAGGTAEAAAIGTSAHAAIESLYGPDADERRPALVPGPENGWGLYDPSIPPPF